MLGGKFAIIPADFIKVVLGLIYIYVVLIYDFIKFVLMLIYIYFVLIYDFIKVVLVLMKSCTLNFYTVFLC